MNEWVCCSLPASQFDSTLADCTLDLEHQFPPRSSSEWATGPQLNSIGSLWAQGFGPRPSHTVNPNPSTRTQMEMWTENQIGITHTYKWDSIGYKSSGSRFLVPLYRSLFFFSLKNIDRLPWFKIKSRAAQIKGSANQRRGRKSAFMSTTNKSTKTQHIERSRFRFRVRVRNPFHPCVSKTKAQFHSIWSSSSIRKWIARLERQQIGFNLMLLFSSSFSPQMHSISKVRDFPASTFWTSDRVAKINYHCTNATSLQRPVCLPLWAPQQAQISMLPQTHNWQPHFAARVLGSIIDSISALIRRKWGRENLC